MNRVSKFRLFLNDLIIFGHPVKRWIDEEGYLKFTMSI